MKPKYLAFRRWLYTPNIFWQGEPGSLGSHFRVAFCCWSIHAFGIFFRYLSRSWAGHAPAGPRTVAGHAHPSPYYNSPRQKKRRRKTCRCLLRSGSSQLGYVVHNHGARFGVVGPLPNSLFMVYKWGLLTTFYVTGMILQVGFKKNPSKYRTHKVVWHGNRPLYGWTFRVCIQNPESLNSIVSWWNYPIWKEFCDANTWDVSMETCPSAHFPQQNPHPSIRVICISFNVERHGILRIHLPTFKQLFSECSFSEKIKHLDHPQGVPNGWEVRLSHFLGWLNTTHWRVLVKDSVIGVGVINWSIIIP